MADSIEINLGGNRPSQKSGEQPTAVDLNRVLRDLVGDSVDKAVRAQLGSVGSTIYYAIRDSLDTVEPPAKPPSSPGSQPSGGSGTPSGSSGGLGGSGSPPGGPTPPGGPPGGPGGGGSPPVPPGPIPPGPTPPRPPGPGGPPGPTPPGPLPAPAPPPVPPVPPTNPAVWVLAVIATAAVLMELANAASRVKDYLDGLAEELSPYRPDISLARANAAIATFESDLRRANQLGPGLSGFVPESTRVGNEIKELGSTLLEPFLDEFTAIAKTIADGVWLIHAGVSPVLELWKKYEEAKEAAGLFAFNPLDALDQLALISKGVTGLKDLLDGEIDKRDSETDITSIIDNLLDPAKFLEDFEKLPSPTDIGYPSRRK